MAKPQKVPGYRYLFRRGGVLVFRRGVPEYALPLFGKGEEHVSFDTGDLKIALPLWAEEVSKFNAKLLRAKAQRAKSLGLPTPRRVPSYVEIEEAVRKSLAERLARNEVDHIFDAADEVVEDYKVQLARQGEDVDEGLKRTGSGPSTTTIWIAEALIDEHDWDVRPDTSSYRYLIRI
ncbi:MAG: hypothetical protein KIT23_05720 [Sphingopyxis sp.]|nr:hypothetical protein [Sphingopyxis sp.]